MQFLRLALALCLALVVSGCSKAIYYDGPPVTRVVVDKGDRVMYLLHHDTILKRYDVGLGFEPEGHKKARGDGRTPEGTYRIDRRNPNSNFFLSIGISYPDQRDIAEAIARGADPGGDIFIHGEPRKEDRDKYPNARDWTAGCIAVRNKEMREIYAMVRNGTPIQIQP